MVTSIYKIAKIVFKSKRTDLQNAIEEIDEILSMLYKNGQIIGSYSVEKCDLNYIANVITTDDDSLDGKYFNSYILKAIENFDIETQIIGDDLLSSDCCHCETHSYFVFAIHPYHSSSPVICGDCGKEIPLIKIPYLYSEEEHYSILNFQQTYNAVDVLWMDSLSDRFSKNQIVNYNSELNKRGLEIRAELEKQLQKPVYYLLANPIGGWYEFEKNCKSLEVCPKCGEKLTVFNNPYAHKVCCGCRLAFVTHE